MGRPAPHAAASFSSGAGFWSWTARAKRQAAIAPTTWAFHQDSGVSACSAPSPEGPRCEHSRPTLTRPAPAHSRDRECGKAEAARRAERESARSRSPALRPRRFGDTKAARTPCVSPRSPRPRCARRFSSCWRCSPPAPCPSPVGSTTPRPTGSSSRSTTRASTPSRSRTPQAKASGASPSPVTTCRARSRSCAKKTCLDAIRRASSTRSARARSSRAKPPSTRSSSPRSRGSSSALSRGSTAC